MNSNSWTARVAWVIAGSTSLFLAAVNAEAAALQPRPMHAKPQQTVIRDHHERHVISVKFRDDLKIRARAGTLVDMGTGALQAARPILDALEEGTWERAYVVDDDRLKSLRDKAQLSLSRQVADLRTQFNFLLPVGADPATVIDALNGLENVEIALPIPRPAPTPLPPNYQNSQGYENPGSFGIGAESVWTLGIRGAGVRLCDVEYSWNTSHQDLPSLTLLGPTPNDPFNDTNHGTAVLGQVASLDNGWGTTGIAHEAEFFVAGANINFWDPGAAIIASLNTLEAGDVILIEQQAFGPNDGFVPIEWHFNQYNAIVTAVGNGVIVVEAAGNGNQNLDLEIYNSGHAPFLPENDSGAIMVGAGAASGAFGSDVARSRLGFSNYGQTVDVQAWGQGVWSTGYGGLYSAEGQNLYYTSSFGGTSSASPIVAGACVLIQSASIQDSGQRLTPAAMREFILAGAWPQQSGTFPASQNIGPLPNVLEAVMLVQGACDPDTDCNENGNADTCDINQGISGDCDGNDVPDECDIALGAAEDCNGNGIPDVCDIDCDDDGVPDDCDTGIEDCNENGMPDACDEDCDANGTPDDCDIEDGTVDDANGNGIPDDCEIDTCGVAAFIEFGATGFSSAGATSDGFPEACGQIERDIWFRFFNLDCDQQITVSVCDANFDSRIAIYGSGCPTGADQAIACNDDGCGQASSVTFDATPLSIYRLRLGGALGASGQGTVIVECGGPMCLTDTDGNGATDVDDLVAVILDWGTAGLALNGDVNNDGIVNVDDVVAVILGWGPCP